MPPWRRDPGSGKENTPRRRQRGPKFLIAALCALAAIGLVSALRGCKKTGETKAEPQAAAPAQPTVDTPTTPPATGTPPVTHAEQPPVTVPEQPPVRPAPKPSTAGSPAANRFIAATDAPDLQLPMTAGRADIAALDRFVSEKAARPAARLEEIVNAFELRPAGAAAVVRGATAAAETLSCPWKPSATLVMIRFQNNLETARDVAATLHFNPAAVARYRLLGHAPVEGSTSMPSRLAEKSGVSLLVEVEPVGAARDLGEIRWSIDGAPAAPLAILRAPDAEPGNDARFAALLAAFSLWNTGGATAPTPDIIAGLARECAASDLPADRKQALVFIARTLELED